MIEAITSAELLAAMEANMVSFWSVYGRASGSTWQATPSVAWFYTGIQIPLFNGVLSARLQPNEVEATVAALQAKIDEQGAPALWWLGPLAIPSNLGALLEQLGLRPAGDVPGMALELALLDDKPEMPPNFSIEKVDSGKMQARWARIAGVGTG